ncbi:P-type cation-transporting ATPase [Lactobacillus helveticus CIRM-BIA 953]|uniref:P-type cation-transporting ATPase n=1 Tax=Lactobacillus helveticus CIRM-BIA 953 TaxID=1226335 RepID=U4QDL2_LACHE|nr:P-type cation-transporting ATPase [Lactobacillus helveticus CIRM-BIA 953]
MLVGNIAEITTLFFATLFNWDAPLLAVHILWVNLATSTLPALALGVDPASKNIMKHKPVKTGTLFEKDLVWRVITQGIFVAMMTLTAYFIGASIDNPLTGQTTWRSAFWHYPRCLEPSTSTQIQSQSGRELLA